MLRSASGVILIVKSCLAVLITSILNNMNRIDICCMGIGSSYCTGNLKQTRIYSYGTPIDSSGQTEQGSLLGRDRLPLVDIIQPPGSRYVAPIQVPANPTCRIPLLADLHQCASVALCPVSGLSFLKVRVSEIRPNRASLDALHHIAYPGLTACVIFLFLPHGIQREIMV